MHLPFPVRRAPSLVGGLTVAAGLGLAFAPSALADSSHGGHAPARGSDHGHAAHRAPAHGKDRGHGASKHHAPDRGHGHGDPRHAPGRGHPDHGHGPSHHGHGDPHHGNPPQGPGNDHGNGGGHGGQPVNLTLGRYAQRNLAADTPGTAEITDPNLINGWGLSFGPRSSGWVANGGTNSSSVFRGAVGDAPVSQIPTTVSVPGELPTGTVFNGTDGFVVRSGDVSGVPRFLFATANGTISGWNTDVPGPNSMEATPAVTVPGATFFGLAIDGDQLYAADFHNAEVDVFDSDYDRVEKPGAFQDPKLPDGWAPFGIEAIGGGKIVVTYALQDPTKMLDVQAPGNGFVDVYSHSGRLLQRLAQHGPLNSPWGIAQAPKDFGPASGALLIGNLGDGHVTAYDPHSGKILGQLGNADGKPLAIDGLWALKFGNGVIGDHNQLLFTAGPSLYAHGLFGELTATSGHGDHGHGK